MRAKKEDLAAQFKDIPPEKLREYGDRLSYIDHDVETIKKDHRKEMRKLHDKYSDQMYKLSQGNEPLQRQIDDLFKFQTMSSS